MDLTFLVKIVAAIITLVTFICIIKITKGIGRIADALEKKNNVQ